MISILDILNASTTFIHRCPSFEIIKALESTMDAFSWHLDSLEVSHGASVQMLGVSMLNLEIVVTINVLSLSSEEELLIDLLLRTGEALQVLITETMHS